MAKKDQAVTYCMATFYLNQPKMNETLRKNESLSILDESAILVQFTAEQIKIISTNRIEKESLKSITMAIVDGRNSYLIINGPVLEVSETERGVLYTVKTPQKQTKTLKNGTILDIECQSVSKYCNIHKAKRIRKKKKEL